jgi:3-oxoacyl-[acyl-carrier-protein] synthase III
MPAAGDFDSFVPAGLASLGIEVDDVDLAVMRATHDLYWPAIAGLLQLDLSAVEPEIAADMSRAPEPS